MKYIICFFALGIVTLFIILPINVCKFLFSFKWDEMGIMDIYDGIEKLCGCK